MRSLSILPLSLSISSFSLQSRFLCFRSGPIPSRADRECMSNRVPVYRHSGTGLGNQNGQPRGVRSVHGLGLSGRFSEFLGTREAMEDATKQVITNNPNPTVLQSKELYEYILNTSVYPRESNLLKELKIASTNHPMAFMGTAPDAGQLMAMILKLVNPRKAIEIGVFTGYSLLLTALTTPDDSKITAIDIDRKAYEIGLPVIKKAGVEHKINFIESPALPILDKLLQEPEQEGSFDFAFVDADKNNYWNYHERLMKLIKVGGIVIYDNTLWGGTVALPEEAVPEAKREWRQCAIEFNKLVSADTRVEISQVPVGDGITICRRIH